MSRKKKKEMNRKWQNLRKKKAPVLLFATDTGQIKAINFNTNNLIRNNSIKFL